MALNFPSSPTIGDVYTDTTSGFSYEWDGTVWKSYTAASVSNIRVLDDISGSFNGSQQTFALTVNSYALNPANAQQLRIVLGGIIQSPGVDYSISGSNIIFTTAPQTGLEFSGISLGPAVPVSYANDGNIYIRNAYTATAGQTIFTFSGGYTVGYLDIYRNGVRLNAGTDFTATNGTSFTLTSPAILNDEIEAIGYKVASLVSATGNLDNLNVTGISTINNLNVTGISTINNLNVTGISTINNLNVSGIATISNSSGTVTIGVGTTALLVDGNARVTGILTVGSSSITLDGANNQIRVGSGLTLTSSGIIGSGSSVTSSAVAYSLEGSPNINVNLANANNLVVSGVTTSNETRFLSVAERIEIVDGNTVSIAYTSTGSNIGFCTNPSGDISLSVTDIPTDSSFDKHAISFAVFINQTGTARSCTSVSLNGVSASIKWSGGSLSQAISGVTTTNGYDIYSFVGFNTVGSASTTDNYEVLGVVSGGFN